MARRQPLPVWQRTPRERAITVPLDRQGSRRPVRAVPDSGGLSCTCWSARIPTSDLDGQIPAGTRSVSVFLVNDRDPDAEQPGPRVRLPGRDRGAAASSPFVPRPDLRGAQARGVGRAGCRPSLRRHARVRDRPRRLGRLGARRRRVPAAAHALDPERRGREDGDRPMRGRRAAMEALGALADGAAAEARARRRWSRSTARGSRRSEPTIAGAAREAARDSGGAAAPRRRCGRPDRARHRDARAAMRMRSTRSGWRTARSARALAQAAATIEEPAWRPFQLAFMLFNLPGLADPRDPNRETVDLLFFPTGGGKTEAYLGLAAFAMVLRRLRHPADGGSRGAGVSVIMRYTLRLLTLDQLARAAGLVCALELEREKRSRALRRVAVRDRPLGRQGSDAEQSWAQGRRALRTRARAKVRQFKADPQGQALADPARELPVVRHALRARLVRASARTTTSRASCGSSARTSSATSSRDRPLPIVAVDEPLYRRLPAFLIATVDKFASLPWVGQSGALLGGADRHDADGLLRRRGAGARARGCSAPLPPPDLVIQDELHLISGPLGTMAGLYETAIEALCARELRRRAPCGRRSSPRPRPCAGRRTRSRRSSRGR